MLGDLFDTQEQLLSGVKEGQVQSNWDRLPRSCADQLNMPDAERKAGYPIGLKNIGQTCYLNSLLQILYHTPELRKVILQLPLCLDTIENKSDFLDHPAKQKFMLGFQRLFSEMSIKDARSLNTQYLKDAFGWEGSEHVQQHDIEEAMKIIFDTFERALHGTEYQKNIKQLFKGTTSQYKNCRVCTYTSERIEDYYGLNVQVKGVQNLAESMMSFVQPESMEGDNKIMCQMCQVKQDMWLGTRIKTMPEILVLTLRRFTFDYELLDRVKINDFFGFNLQTDFTHLLEDSNDNQEYQLYGVIIHRGSAHGGHYYGYIRDVMQQSDWENSIKQTLQLEKKKSEDRQKDKEALTEEQKKKREELDNQNKTHNLQQPKNKHLLKNWFCLDDSICQGIDANKITSKYEGSQSAYILFYRKKGLQIPKQIKVPKYFSSIIQAQNDVLKKQRAVYEEKKRQIVLKIDGESEIINLGTKVNDFMEIYCPIGYSLVNEAKHNQLPYYPIQLNSLQEKDAQQTIENLDLIHESTWKKYNIESEQYQIIRNLINKDKLPFQLNIFYSGSEKNTKIVLFQDQILSQLKYRLQQLFAIPYEKQIIKLVTPYKQYFVTDDLKNDDVLLLKLGFVHECQIILKKLEIKNQGKQQEDIKEAKVQMENQGTLYCFVVERDDITGIKRMYYDKTKTLEQFFNHVKQLEALPQNISRRFRNLNGDRLLYADQYSKTLEDLKFDEQIIKLRIERGQIPIKGDICVRTKMQSKFQSQDTPMMTENIFDPNVSVLDVKKAICEKFNLEYEKHKIYQTDWMGEPVRPITKQKQTIFDANFGRQQIICLRDIQSPIGTELMYFEIYQTLIGSPEDVSAKFPLKIQQTKTLSDLKKMILESQLCKDIEGLDEKQIRIRELKRDYMLGNILKNNKNELKNLGLNGNKLVIQILDRPEELNDSQIVLLLKKRNVEKQIYEGSTELIFDAGKNPSIEQLMEAVRSKIQAKPEEEIKIIKYIYYNFEWVEICQKSIDKFLKGKAKPENKKEKKNKGGDTKKVEESSAKVEDKKQQKQIAQNQGKQKEKNDQKTQEKEQNKMKPIEEKVKVQQNQKEKTEKKGKKNKGNNQQKTKQQIKKEECLNLRRAPFLLKDGDWIGYGLVNELKGDSLQTEQDLTLRNLRRHQKDIGRIRPKGQQIGFRMNLDF